MKPSDTVATKVLRTVRSRTRNFAIRAEQHLTPSRMTMPRGRLPLYWWKAKLNFGDLLSPELLRTALDLRGVWVPPPFERKVLFVGSIIHNLAPGDVVIGSGAIADRQHHLPDSATVVGLRGPRTRALLGLRKTVPFGDPGIVAASMFGITRSDPNGRIALIPHHSDAPEVRRLFDRSKLIRDECDILDVANTPRNLIEQVSRYDACISSSLHGVIVAESLGIPTIAVSFGDRLIGGAFKFADYFEGTGRSFEGLSSIDAALSTLERGVSREPHIDQSPVFRMLEHAAEVLDRPGP